MKASTPASCKHGRRETVGAQMVQTTVLQSKFLKAIRLSPDTDEGAQSLQPCSKTHMDALNTNMQPGSEDGLW